LGIKLTVYDFHRLEIGTEVIFVESAGEKGPQASTVQIVSKPGVRHPATEEHTVEPAEGWKNSDGNETIRRGLENSVAEPARMTRKVSTRTGRRRRGTSYFSSLAFNEISVAARATDTGQFFFAPSACSANVFSSMSGISASVLN
jgi:hypothetical protein